MEENKKHHRSQVTQMPIYLGKFFRMFIYLDDWKVIPMGAVIAGLVSYVVCSTMFVSMEGTLKGGLAIACVCIWNGCFNSIQVVCRERGIIKREHRSGMYITSYIASHMVYQAFLCLLQTIVSMTIFQLTGFEYPSKGAVTPFFIVDFAVTLFLITYAADMLSLLLSCIAKSTTAAMTIMPFVLIFELVFSGSMFSLSGTAKAMTNLSIAKWGIQGICSEAGYNELPMTSAWTMMQKFKDYEYEGIKPMEVVIDYIEENDKQESLMMAAASSNQNVAYEKTADNVKNCWYALIIFSIVEAGAAVLVLKRIDKDRR